MDMSYYNMEAVKAKKRNVILIFALALIPLTVLIGYQLYSIAVMFIDDCRNGILLAMAALVFRIFVRGIVLIVISTVWLGICCYSSLRKFHDIYCKQIFPQAIAQNPDYTYLKFVDSLQMLRREELLKAKVIHPDSIHKQKEVECLTGQYRHIDFEMSPLTLSHGRNQEIRGCIAVFTGFPSLFSPDEFVQISCSGEEDVFAEYLPAKRGLVVKKRIATSDYRKGLITAPNNQSISEEQFVLLEQLILMISEQGLTGFYIIFAQGHVYFIRNGSTLMIQLPLWHGIEKELQDVEKNGIVNVSLFVDAFLRVLQ